MICGVPAERLTWLGHATVVLEIGGARLITDPLLRARLAHLRRVGPRPDADASAALDAVLISHLHFDHLDVPSLRAIGESAQILAPRGAGRFLRGHGFESVTELTTGDTVMVGEAAVTAIPATHDGRRHPLGREAETIGFEIAGEHRVYFAGDTDLFAGMSAFGGRFDTALLPVWGWGPSLGPGHLDPEGAAQAAALLRPQVVVPIHWGTFFPAGLHRVLGRHLVEPPVTFERAVARLAPEIEVRVLAPGGSLELR
jgi:L-ascorbate metabolism protein UlaG (beta-lactamase superfamily)